MYVVVAWGGDVGRLVGRWRWSYRYRHRDVDWAVLAERTAGDSLVAVFNGSFMGLFGALKLKGIAEELGFVARLYRADYVYDINEVVEGELRKLSAMDPRTVQGVRRLLHAKRFVRKTLSSIDLGSIYAVEAIVREPGELKKLYSAWRSNFKSRLPAEIREHILLEKTRFGEELIVVFRGSSIGLALFLKFYKIALKHAWRTALLYGKEISDTSGEIEEKIREKIEELPPEHVYAVKKALVAVRLPRKKEVIEVMKLA